MSPTDLPPDRDSDVAVVDRETGLVQRSIDSIQRWGRESIDEMLNYLQMSVLNVVMMIRAVSNRTKQLVRESKEDLAGEVAEYQQMGRFLIGEHLIDINPDTPQPDAGSGRVILEDASVAFIQGLISSLGPIGEMVDSYMGRQKDRAVARHLHTAMKLIMDLQSGQEILEERIEQILMSLQHVIRDIELIRASIHGIAFHQIAPPPRTLDYTEIIALQTEKHANIPHKHDSEGRYWMHGNIRVPVQEPFTLPNDVSYAELNVSGSGIVSTPPDLNVTFTFRADHCRGLEHIADGFETQGIIRARNNPRLQRAPHMGVGWRRELNEIDYSNCPKLTSIGNGTWVDDLWLCNTGVTELPDDIRVNRVCLLPSQHALKDHCASREIHTTEFTEDEYRVRQIHSTEYRKRH